MSNIARYITIKKGTEALLKDSGSKFFALAFPVIDIDDIDDKINQVKNLYPGATHYCYAWRLGKVGEFFRANDDGEPGNSAGQPIYRQILSYNLTHVLVIVVRFYGGKKLGISGLISAYGGSAALALELAEVVEVEPQILVEIRHNLKLDYQIYEFAKRYEGDIISAPNIPGDVFVLKFSLTQWEEVLVAFKELPNYDWKQID